MRRREDGNLEFIGRLDHQVKLRGYRIELGEIETALEGHPKVKQAVALLREDQPGMTRLAAYVVRKAAEEPLSSNELRRYLKEHLPEYMVPIAFVELESLPLSANGKIDRNSLPAPEAAQDRSKQNFVAPQTPAEELLAESWAALLQVEAVGIHDNFFELGGHSLLATQMVSRVRKTLHMEVPLRSFFDAPTIHGLLHVLGDVAGGRQIVEEIAQTYMQIWRMSDGEVKQLLSEQEPARDVLDPARSLPLHTNLEELPLVQP